jgi:hypothetical protein
LDGLVWKEAAKRFSIKPAPWAVVGLRGRFETRKVSHDFAVLSSVSEAKAIIYYQLNVPVWKEAAKQNGSGS